MGGGGTKGVFSQHHNLIIIKKRGQTHFIKRKEWSAASGIKWGGGGEGSRQARCSDPPDADLGKQ